MLVVAGVARRVWWQAVRHVDAVGRHDDERAGPAGTIADAVPRSRAAEAVGAVVVAQLADAGLVAVLGHGALGDAVGTVSRIPAVIALVGSLHGYGHGGVRGRGQEISFQSLWIIVRVPCRFKGKVINLKLGQPKKRKN